MNTYAEKINNSEREAHNQNIATKILKDLKKIRAVDNLNSGASRRWIWELIQNAKDVSYDGKIRIKIYKESSLEHGKSFVFSHNGSTFSADNIRYLIEQISTKDQDNVEDGKRKTTGKFGTGFLTTHLLSEVVYVDGIVKDDGLDYKKIKVKLDRTGVKNTEIIDSVNAAREEILKLDSLPTVSNYDQTAYNTRFIYELNDSNSNEIIKFAIKDLKKCLPFSLLFCEELDIIEIGSKTKYFGATIIKEFSNTISLRKVKYENKTEKGSHYFLLAENKFTKIALPVSYKKAEKTIRILPIEDNIPRIFCEFPLIGSECFSFPAIINNPNFNPTEPRDGVFLNTPMKTNSEIEENKSIISEAVDLFNEIVSLCEDKKYLDLYELARITDVNSIGWVDEKWYRSYVLNPLQKKLNRSNIVLSVTGKLKSLKDNTGKPNIFIPKGRDKSIRSNIHGVATKIVSRKLPIQSTIEFWNRYSWEGCGRISIDWLCSYLENHGSLESVKSELGDFDSKEWLKKLYELIRSDEYSLDSNINKYRLFPNQNGEFCKVATLRLEKDIIREDLKDIISLLDNDVRATLAHPDFVTEQHSNDNPMLESDVINLIRSEVTAKTQDRERSKRYRPALSLLLKWFREEEADARKLFPYLFKKKYLLYDEEEILENVEKAEQLSSLMKEYKVNDFEALKQILSNFNDKAEQSCRIFPITSEIISSMGIESVEEWELAMQDEDIKQMFLHSPTPSTEMFAIAYTYIKKAKENIWKELQSLEEYDLSLAEFISTTVLSGVKKNSNMISIVCRPAYKGEVILYYGAERDALDYSDAELWIDSGKEVKPISLGHIIKTNNIVKFPV